MYSLQFTFSNPVFLEPHNSTILEGLPRAVVRRVLLIVREDGLTINTQPNFTKMELVGIQPFTVPCPLIGCDPLIQPPQETAKHGEHSIAVQPIGEELELLLRLSSTPLPPPSSFST